MFLRALGDMRVLLFSSLSKSVHSSLLVYDCLQILKHVAAIFMVCNFHFTFVSIFECSTSFVPIYLILTLCFYQHEDVSMNLDLLKRMHVLDNLIIVRIFTVILYRQTKSSVRRRCPCFFILETKTKGSGEW